MYIETTISQTNICKQGEENDIKNWLGLPFHTS